jgi:ERCC4-type nuclease
LPISLDFRTGSKELAPLFLPYGIQPQLTKLDFGDLAFEGNGPQGRCAIVIERKQIADLIASIQSRRLSGHQLPGMADTYDYCYLIVEGVWRPGPEGEMQLGYGGMQDEKTFGGSWRPVHGRSILYRAVDNYLSTLELHAGLIYRRTLDALETVHTIVDLYHWWNDKQWMEHSSHLGVYAPGEPKLGRGRKLNLVRREISLAEKWAMQLDGIDTKAQAAAKHFGSARALADAVEADWIAIRGIGKPTAQQVVRAINAETHKPYYIP